MCMDEKAQAATEAESDARASSPRSGGQNTEPRVHIDGKSFPARVLKIHRSIAARMGKGFLRCDNCNREQDLSAAQVERYLEGGWPVCCEGTLNGGKMGYHRPEERRK